MTEPRHGDPLDYPDIPGDSGLSDEYCEAAWPDHVKEAIARRKAERAVADAPDGGLIDNEGAPIPGICAGIPARGVEPPVRLATL